MERGRTPGARPSVYEAPGSRALRGRKTSACTSCRAARKGSRCWRRRSVGPATESAIGSPHVAGDGQGREPVAAFVLDPDPALLARPRHLRLEGGEVGDGSLGERAQRLQAQLARRLLGRAERQRRLAERRDVQAQLVAGVLHVAQRMAALEEGQHLDHAALDAADQPGLAGLVAQQLGGFRGHRVERVAGRDLLCHRKQPGGRIEAPAARGAQQVAELVQRVQQVRAAALWQVHEPRQVGIGELALFAREQLEQRHRAGGGGDECGHISSDIS